MLDVLAVFARLAGLKTVQPARLRQKRRSSSIVGYGYGLGVGVGVGGAVGGAGGVGGAPGVGMGGAPRR